MFSLTSILMLGLGFALNTTMFSVLNTVLIRPLPYSHAGELVQIWETDSSRGESRGVISLQNFLDWQTQNQSFARMATYEYSSVVLTGQKEAQRMFVSFVSSGFFDVFEQTPLKGRTFLFNEDAARGQMAVLSYGAWERYFGQDPNIIGKSIVLDGESFSVVGIMPASFDFPGAAIEAWCLRHYDVAQIGRRRHFLFGIGRLRAGVNLAQSQAEMTTIANQLAIQYPSNRSSGIRLVSLQEETVGKVRTKLLTLWGAVLAVLLIACANVAGLSLARAISRQKEVAIRAALGGSRKRLAQQVLTESLFLACIGGIVGLLISFWLGPIVIASSHGAVPRLRNFHLDIPVLVFTGIACVFTGLLFGCAPALYTLRSNINVSLKEGGKKYSDNPGRLSMRNALVVGELALALVLVVLAALLTQTLWSLQNVNPGFQPAGILGFRFSLPKGTYPEGRDRAALYERINDRIAAIPGVESVGATNNLPFSGSRSITSFEIEGHPFSAGGTLDADYRAISPDFLQTMRARLVFGRLFTRQDNHDAPNVMIVNQAFVQRFLPNLAPLDQRLRVHGQIFNVVGVIADFRHDNLALPGSPEMYFSYLQDNPSSTTFIALRSRIEIASLIAAVRDAVKEIAPDIPIYDLRDMDARIAATLGSQKFTGFLLAIFGALALILAGIGVYAVMAYNVAQRTHEIGIRMALGADGQTVLYMILWDAAKLGIVGLSLGIIAALIVMRTLASILYGLDMKVSAIFAAVAILLFVLVLMASYGPARWASKVDTLEALRYE
jgi:putative ABC transport system permease protein